MYATPSERDAAAPIAKATNEIIFTILKSGDEMELENVSYRTKYFA